MQIARLHLTNILLMDRLALLRKRLLSHSRSQILRLQRLVRLQRRTLLVRAFGGLAHIGASRLNLICTTSAAIRRALLDIALIGALIRWHLLIRRALVARIIEHLSRGSVTSFSVAVFRCRSCFRLRFFP